LILQVSIKEYAVEVGIHKNQTAIMRCGRLKTTWVEIVFLVELYSICVEKERLNVLIQMIIRKNYS